MEDSGQNVQGQVAFSSAELQKAIAAFAEPSLRASISKLLADLGSPGMEPASVRKQYSEARDKTNKDFDAAQAISEAGVRQDILQAGGRGGTPARATDAIVSRASREIERGRVQTLGALEFEEASAGLGHTNYLLSSLLKAGNTAVGGALGYGANASAAGQILSATNAQNRQQGATYGSMAGTILGALLAGYTGGASIPIGSAVGGAVGGYLGGG